MKARADFRPFRPGHSWKNGKLYAFSRTDVIVLSPWPDLRAWRRTKALHWHQIRPHISIRTEELWVESRVSRLSFRGTAWAGFPPSPDAKKDHLAEALQDPGFAALLERLDLHETAKRMNDSDPLKWDDPTFLAWREVLRDALVRFWEPVPADIRSRIARFPTHHWHLASLFARCPASVDVADSTPALAMMLANAWIFNRRPSRSTMRWVRRHIVKPQRVLCGLLGFPSTESAVHVLRKLAPEHCHPAILLDLRTLMRIPAMLDHLRHIPALPPHLLRFLIVAHRKGWSVSRRLITRWLAHFADPSRDLGQHWKNVQDALRVLVPGTRNHPELPFHSVNALLREHQAQNEELAERIAMEEEEGRGAAYVYADTMPPSFLYADQAAVQLPPPPLPGNDAIQPLRTGRDVLDESRDMRHCVATYLPMLKEGKLFIYRVLQPERATLEIHHDGVAWRMGQLAGVANAPVSIHTRILVRAWLTHYQSDCRLDPAVPEDNLVAAA